MAKSNDSSNTSDNTAALVAATDDIDLDGPVKLEFSNGEKCLLIVQHLPMMDSVDSENGMAIELENQDILKTHETKDDIVLNVCGEQQQQQTLMVMEDNSIVKNENDISTIPMQLIQHSEDLIHDPFGMISR